MLTDWRDERAFLQVTQGTGDGEPDAGWGAAGEAD